jgi:mannan endo-1,6-alpha-mannosidase
MEYDYPPITPCVPLDSTGSGGEDLTCANSWTNIAMNVFGDFVGRWLNDSVTCNGGLKWQYRTSQAGYWYKNSVSNGGFFQTSARLARYTGNSVFAMWAATIWDWSSQTGLISSDYHVYDGASDQNGANCSSINPLEWSYNIGSYLHGAAHMYAYSQSANATQDGTEWEQRVQGLLKTIQSVFFSPFSNATNIMFEPECEEASTCSTDQESFKASLAQWLGKTAVLVPSVAGDIQTMMQATAQGVASSCSGQGANTCGMKYYIGGWDGQASLGVQLSALETVQSLLVSDAPQFATEA